MNSISVKATIFLMLTIAILILSFATEDIIESRLYASIGFFMAIYVVSLLSNKPRITD
jgi:hypothetical protein